MGGRGTPGTGAGYRAPTKPSTVYHSSSAGDATTAVAKLSLVAAMAYCAALIARTEATAAASRAAAASAPGEGVGGGAAMATHKRLEEGGWVGGLG